MSISHAFHDGVNKGLFIDTENGLFFVKDEEVDEVGYNPVQHGKQPVTTTFLKSLLVLDRDGWTRSNLRSLGYNV